MPIQNETGLILVFWILLLIERLQQKKLFGYILLKYLGLPCSTLLINNSKEKVKEWKVYLKNVTFYFCHIILFSCHWATKPRCFQCTISQNMKFILNGYNYHDKTVLTFLLRWLNQTIGFLRASIWFCSSAGRTSSHQEVWRHLVPC